MVTDLIGSVFLSSITTPGITVTLEVLALSVALAAVGSVESDVISS